jgi:hypothetical protein
MGVGGVLTAGMRPESAENAAPKKQLFAKQQLLANNRSYRIFLAAVLSSSVPARRDCMPFEEWGLWDLGMGG